MSRLRDDLVRAALAGASTGGRTFTAVEALALTARPDAESQPDATLTKPWVRGVLGVLALGELAADKLPFAPSRLEAPGFAGRLVFGGVCGAIIARRVPDPAQFVEPLDPLSTVGDSDRAVRTLACVVTGTASAAGAAWLGVRWRARAASVLRRDWIGAQLEDAAVAALASAASRRR